MPGKKAKSPIDQKTRTIKIRLSENDYLLLKDYASSRKLSISDLVRSLIPTPPQSPILIESSDPTEPNPKEITLPGYPGTFKVRN